MDIPVFSHRSQRVSDEFNLLDFLCNTSVISSIKTEVKKQFEEEGDEFLDNFQCLMGELDIEIKQGNFIKMAESLSDMAVKEFACFDDSQGVLDYRKYTDKSLTFLISCARYEEKYSFLSHNDFKKGKRKIFLASVADIFISGLEVMIDMKSEDVESYKKYFFETCATMSINQDELRSYFLKFTSENDFDRPVSPVVQKYCIDLFDLVETKETRKTFDTVFDDLMVEFRSNTYSPNCEQFLIDLVGHGRLLPEKIFFTEKDGRNVREQKKKDFLDEKMENFLDVVESYIYNKDFNKQNFSVAIVTKILLWMQTVASSKEEYEGLCSDYTINRLIRFMIKLGATYDDFKKNSDIFQLKNDPENIFGKRIFDESLSDHKSDVFDGFGHLFMLSELDTKQGKDFFYTLENHLHLYPVTFSYPEDLPQKEISEINKKIIDLGLEALRTIDINSLEFTRALYTLSFFIADITLSQSVQDYACTILGQTDNYKGVSDLFFRRYQRQNKLLSENSIDILEKKSRSPEEIEETIHFLKAKYIGKDFDSFMGALVGVEFASEKVFKGTNRSNMLKSMISSGGDESNLRNEVSTWWYAIYREPILRAVENGDHLTEKRPYLATLSGTRFFAYVPAEEMLQRLYRLNNMQKTALLKDLLLHHKTGVLSNTAQRQKFLSYFLSHSLERDQDLRVKEVINDILSAVFEQAPSDELFLVLSPILRPRILLKPKECDHSWKPQAENLFDTYIKDDPELLVSDGDNNSDFYLSDEDSDNDNESSSQGVVPFLEAELKKDFAGESDVYGKISELVPEVFLNTGRVKQNLKPVEMVLEIARHFGAPGVRFLQLLGQTIPLESDYREQFSAVYDSMKGQSKFSLWEGIKFMDSHYASQITEIGDKLGGGSLFTVYEAFLSDGTKEVVRVLNPNAWYHAKKALSIMRASVNVIIRNEKKSPYKKALPLLDTIEEWIMTELKDETFDNDDIKFRQKWDGWRPNKNWKRKIKVPVSRSTATTRIRREEYIPGENLTALATFNDGEKKELVALAVSHFVSQLKGLGMFDLGDVLVHSDVSPGNLRKMPNGDLAILDRNKYLSFTLTERLALKGVLDKKEAQSRSEYFVRWLLNMSENKNFPRTQEKEAEIVKKIVQNSSVEDKSRAALEALVVVQECGIKVPLKYTLLFKNLNALNRMSLDAGFSGIEEALSYNPK